MSAVRVCPIPLKNKLKYYGIGARIDDQVKGTKIIIGNKKRRQILNKFIEIVESEGFSEIVVPTIEPSKVYIDKAGEEILNQMYVFEDKGGRNLCLRPEVTATIQLIADKYWKSQKDVKLWYFEKCYRYEKPQRGRYREFFQFGVEWINPRNYDECNDYLINLAEKMISTYTKKYEIFSSVKRGLNYYVDNGFEISLPELGSQKQVVGGGRYKQGIGFAIGFDRLLCCE